MNAETVPSLPYNSSMFRWAREWRGRTQEEAAKKINVPVERIYAWETPGSGDAPTVRQARQLAEFYDRAFLEFFYDAPPTIAESGLIPDFRATRDAPDPHQNREILAIQHWAEAQRLNALDLFDSLGDPPITFPESFHGTIADDVEVMAEAVRKHFDFSIERQFSMTAGEQKQLPSLLRQKIEGAGVLVLRKNALSEYGVSGLCIVAFPMPVIVFAAEAPGRQAFTLMHEFAHIILQQSAISGPEYSRSSDTYDRKVEHWCNQFASAFLVPRTALNELRPLPKKPAKSIDDDILAAIAKTFRVSPHAMLIRLVNLGYVEPEYYWNTKLHEFRREELLWKGRGRSKYWASRIVSTLGQTYTGLVLEALGTGKIPFHQAVEFMGLPNSTHLGMIRQEFGGA